MADIYITATPITIATAGVAVQVAADTTIVKSIIFEADPSNSGLVYIGGSNVTSSNGNALNAEQTLEITPDDQRGNAQEFDLSGFWVDSATNGNVVRVSYTRKKG